MRKLARFCAVFTTGLWLAGCVCVIAFAWKTSTIAIGWSVLGLFLSLCLSPSIHEWGHILFGKTQGMRLTYTKFFCFKLQERGGRLRCSFASPFLAEQTQMLPLKSGNMKKRAAAYTLGGVLLGTIAFAAFSLAAVCLAVEKKDFGFFFFGLLPYTGYLALLNAFPVYFGDGATDGLVLKGIKNGEAEAENMLAAMEIFGCLSEGKSFSEIDESLYFSLPVIPEDVPVYATIVDLRYRYFLEKGDLDEAGAALNRLASLSGYLPSEQVEEIAAELCYMHAILGDCERMQEARKACEKFLASETVQAKRIAAACMAATGEAEQAEKERERAAALLDQERISGKRKAERILLERTA